MKTKSIKLSEIVTDAGTQIRTAICEETVNRYAEAMQDGDVFPAVVLFWDGNRYILADGFHRFFAAKRSGFKDILAEVHDGTRSDALKHALKANATHGKPRTNEDKRNSVKLALSEWPNVSSREIARICAVSNQFVDNMRSSQLSTVDSSTANESQLKRTGADGKERKMPVKKVQEPEFNCPPMNKFKAPETSGNKVKTADEEFESEVTIDDLNRDAANIIADMSSWSLAALVGVKQHFLDLIEAAAKEELDRR